MSTDDILDRIRDEFPAEMGPVDAMLFRAGYLRGGAVVSGCEAQVRALVTSLIPLSTNYFHSNAPEFHTADATTPAPRRRRV